MEYNHNEDGTISYAAFINPETSLLFEAAGLRKTSTGLHATITLTLQCPGKILLLDYDTFNVGRREERQRLAFAAHRFWESKDIPAPDKEELKHYLDSFCRDLDTEWQRQFWPEETEGNPMIEQSFWLHPYIAQGSGTIIFAPPGRGKSYCGKIMSILIHYDLGHLWPVQQGQPLYINLERSKSSVERRIGQINQALGLNPDAPLTCLHARGKTLEMILPSARRYVKERGINLVVVDSLSRMGVGDLTANEVANSAVDMLNSLCETWVVLAHTPRGNATHPYGSIMYEAGADLVVQLLTQEKEHHLGIGLQVVKKNDIPQPPVHILALEFDQAGLSGIRWAHKNEFLDIESAKTKTHSEAIYEYLLDIGKSSPSRIADSLGINRVTVQGILRNDSRILKLEREGKEQLYGVAAR